MIQYIVVELNKSDEYRTKSSTSDSEVERN